MTTPKQLQKKLDALVAAIDSTAKGLPKVKDSTGYRQWALANVGQVIDRIAELTPGSAVAWNAEIDLRTVPVGPGSKRK